MAKSKTRLKLFISYRRTDEPFAALLINNFLKQEFSRVYYDLESIPLGTDFRENIQRAIYDCDVLLVLIGTNWIDPKTLKRLRNPADFVRIEILSALRRDIPVIPVLVGDARIPHENELPEEIANLAFRNACRVRSDNFSSDIVALVEGIRRVNEIEYEADKQTTKSTTRGKAHTTTKNTVIWATGGSREPTFEQETLRLHGFNVLVYSPDEVLSNFTSIKWKDSCAVVTNLLHHKNYSGGKELAEAIKTRDGDIPIVLYTSNTAVKRRKRHIDSIPLAAIARNESELLRELKKLRS